MPRILIAGAGLAGRLLAFALARSGHEARVFDPAAGPEPRFDGQGAAAFTAAGMLSPLAEQETAEPEVAALGWRSIQLWPQLLAAAGADKAFACRGSLLLAHAQDRGAADRVLARLGSSAPAPLDSNALHELEPALLGAGLRAWHLPGEAHIDTVAAMAALHGAAAHVDWRWGCSVSAVTPGRIELADGSRHEADWAIDARGLGARPQLPALRGVRGEVAVLELATHGIRRPLRLLHPRHRVYVVPRSAHTLVVGASEIESEDRSPVSVRSAVELLAAAHSICPALAEARILRLDRNLRPALPDHRPIVTHEPGLARINGLYRHGWLLAPALAEQLLAGAGLGALIAPAP